MENFAGLELPDSRWVDVDGPVHYREWPGPHTGPTFVLVHGLGGSLLNWALVAPGLARHGRVLALDLVGFGLTPADGRTATIGSQRGVLDGFLRTLELPPVILVGNSMGGKLSLVQAAHAPDTVSALVLTNAAFPRARAIRAQPSAKVAVTFAIYANKRFGEWFVQARARRLGPEGLVREALQIIAADPRTIDSRLVEAHIEMARRRQEFDYAVRAYLEAARSIFRAQAYPVRYRELVRRVKAPALVLHGAKDILVPLLAAREAAAEHPNWKLVVFSELGHIPQMEAPERWLAAVEDWLRERAGEPSVPEAPEAERAV